ncbi:MAG: hypothetical protein K8S55_05385 [Phycisphaerae bacterium]|nr:hypothetical protein [Phycisphaerae bacterium]
MALVSAGLLSGCAQTIDNDEMVRLYLAQAPPGQSEFGWYANYNGLHAGYHHLKVEYSNFGAGPFIMFTGASTTKEYRCKAETLPPGFPEDLAEALWDCRKAAGTANYRQRVDKAVSEYLQQIKTRDKPGKPGQDPAGRSLDSP